MLSLGLRCPLEKIQCITKGIDCSFPFCSSLKESFEDSVQRCEEYLLFTLAYSSFFSKRQCNVKKGLV